MREKLIELLESARTGCIAHEKNIFCHPNDPIAECPYGKHGKDCYIHVQADHLIANGVTVREKGEWYGVGNMYMCGVCHEQEYVSTNYCPNCGADMRGET